MPAKTTSARLSQGGRGPRRLGVLLAALAALLLAGIVVVASQTPPAPPPVAEPTPTPIPPAGERLYLLQRNLGSLDQRPFLEALDAQPPTLRYALADALAAALSPDGSRLFVVGADSLRALEAGSGRELWRVPVSDVAGERGFGPSPLLVSGDGRRLLVLSSRSALPFADLPVRWLQVFDPVSGWRMHVSDPFNIGANDNGGGPITLADAGTHAALLQPGRGLLFFDFEQLRFDGGMNLPQATGEAALSANRRLLYVLESRSGAPFLTEIDLRQRQAGRSVELGAGQLLEPVAGALKVVAAKERVAIGFWRLGAAPGDPSGAPTPLETQLRLYDPATWAETERQTITQMLAPGTLAVSGDGAALRMVLQDAGLQQPLLASYALDGSRQLDSQPLDLNRDIAALLLGPAAPHGQQPAAQQPEPNPSALPSHMAPLSDTAGSAEPLAAVLQSSGSGQGELRLIGGQGEQTTVITNVQAAIERPGRQPAAIVNADDASLWLVAEERVPLLVAPGCAPHAPLLAPDGRTIIFKTMQDPFPEDAYPATFQLVSADLQTGAAKRLTDADAAPELISRDPVAWIGDTIYFQPAVYSSGSRETWQLDLGAAEPAPTRAITGLIVFDDQAQFAPASARMAYAWPDVSAQGVMGTLLILRDLAGGDDTVLPDRLEGGDSFALAPDGRHVAYLLEDAAGVTEVALQRLPEQGAPGERQIIGRGFWPQTRQMFWSADSQFLLMPIAGAGLQNGDAAELLIWRASDGGLDRTVRLPTGWFLLSRMSAGHRSPVQIDGERLVALATDQRQVYLIDVEWAAPDRIGYLPLPPSANRLLWTR